MPVETTLSRVQYDTNGTTGPWSIPFYFLEDADILAVYADSTGAETNLVLTTDYSLTGAGDESGGTMTTVSAYAAGGTLTILRDVDALQTTEFQDGDNFPASAVNRGLDRLTMIVQQLKEKVGRALLFPVSDDTSGALPSATDRANTQITFDSSGALNFDAPASGSAADVLIRLASSAVGWGSKLVAYMLRATGSVARWVEDKLSESVSVLDFDGVEDGTDSTAGLQAALNYVAGGYPLKVPKGMVFIASSTLIAKANTKLIGGGTIKLADGADVHLIENEHYASGTDENIVLSGVILDGNQANQSAYAGSQNTHVVHMKGVSGLKVRFSEIKNAGVDCINLIDCEHVEVLLNHLWGARNHAVTFQNTPGLRGIGNRIHNCGSKTDAYGITSSGHAFIGVNVRCDDVILSKNYVYDMGDSCLRNAQAGEGWVISNNLVVNSGKDSIKIMGTTGANPRPKANVISGNVVIDAGCDGIVAMGACVVSGNFVYGTGKNTAGAAVGKWFASASGIKVIDYSDRAQVTGNYCQDGLYAGIYISGANDCAVRSNYCYLNGVAGIVSFDSNRITIENNDCLDNGTATVGTGSGIRVSISGAATQDDVSVRNNTCRNTTTVNQGYGVYLSGATTTGFRVTHNDVRGNAVTGILNSATGSDNIIRFNDGFATEAYGTATIPNGATSVLVNHGLAVTPTISQISVTPTNLLGAANKFGIGTVSSTQFQIQVDVNPGASTATFSWQIV